LSWTPTPSFSITPSYTPAATNTFTTAPTPTCGPPVQTPVSNLSLQVQVVDKSGRARTYRVVREGEVWKLDLDLPAADGGG